MKKKLFWGLFLILAGAYLIVSQMGYLPPVGVMRTLLTVAALAILIQSLLHLSFGGILFPLALFGILYDEQLGITEITPWTILVAALLLTIGLNLIFGGIKKKHRRDKWDYHDKHEKFNSVETVEEGENIQVETKFGGVTRYITTENFHYAAVDAKFSGVKLYFQDAKVPTGSATLDVDISFSGLELYVPRDWKIVNHIQSSCGAVSEKGKMAAEPETTLMLEGTACFAGVTVHYM